MNTYLINSIVEMVFAKLMPFAFPLVFLLSVLLFSDRLISFLVSVVKK